MIPLCIFFFHGTHFFVESMYSRLNSYFTIITKKKLHFSLVCSFYFCLAKEGWALKAAEQFTIRGLVAYKPVGYKKSLILSAAACLFPKKVDSCYALFQRYDKYLYRKLAATHSFNETVHYSDIKICSHAVLPTHFFSSYFRT